MSTVDLDERRALAAMTIIAFLAISLCMLNTSGVACAAEPVNLHDMLFGRRANGHLGVPAEGPDRPPPTVARYEGEGGVAFIFGRTPSGRTLLKFDGDPEIWALTPTTGPRGDVIYKNDVGEPVLRSTRMGGMTVFTPGQPAGVPAAFVEETLVPRPPPVLGPDGLFQIEINAALRATRAAQHRVDFDSTQDSVTPATEVVFAEAFIVTSEAFERVSQKPKAAQGQLMRIVTVRFVTGHSPSASLHGPTMQITVAPDLGVAGRPSSERVAAVIGRR
jgi:hypothetical protein